MEDTASFTIVQCSVGGDTPLADGHIQRDLDLVFHWSGLDGWWEDERAPRKHKTSDLTRE